MDGIGLATKWEGIEYIYPDYCQYNNTEEIVNSIIEYTKNESLYQEISNKSKQFIIDNYDINKIWNIILKNIYGD